MHLDDIAPRACVQCATVFTPKAASLKRGPGKFCSKSCAGKSFRGKALRPVEERFWEKVDKDGPIPEHRPELGSCWIWTGSRHPDGRGQFHFRQRTYFASVVAFILTYGDPTSEKPWVLHACDAAKLGCIRPSHLFAGTAAENSADMVEKGRSSSGEWTKTHPELLARGDRHGSKTHPERVQRGETCTYAVLTEDIVIESRARYAAGGVTIRELANDAGVKFMTMCGAVRRKNWRHLP